MHLVIIAWLYVIGVMAIAAPSATVGLLLFVFAGLVPVLGWLGLLARRIRARRAAAASASRLQPKVHDGDDADA